MKRLLPLLIILPGCTHTVTLTDGDRRCEVQSRTALDAESVQSIRTIVVDVATGVRREMVSQAAPQPASMDCDSKMCISLTPQGCSIEVKK